VKISASAEQQKKQQIFSFKTCCLGAVVMGGGHSVFMERLQNTILHPLCHILDTSALS